MKRIRQPACLICVTLLGVTIGIAKQDCRAQAAIQRSDQVTTAKILKALNEDWALVDYADNIDFLVLVSEDREELDFYPKKKLVKQLERSGLIVNLDPKSSAARQPETYWEGDSSSEEWKEITEAGIIVCQYKVTAAGSAFLKDVARRTAGGIPPLRITNQEVEIKPKVLKVVTYNKQAIEKLTEAFVQQARTVVEKAFSPEDPDLKSLAAASPLWGPKLVNSVGLPKTNGVVARMVLREEKTTMIGGGRAETVSRERPEVGLSGQELQLFLKATAAKFPLTDRVIRKANAAEATTYPLDHGTLPMLMDRVELFVVETAKAHFVVAVKNTYDSATNRLQANPKLQWIEFTREIAATFRQPSRSHSTFLFSGVDSRFFQSALGLSR